MSWATRRRFIILLIIGAFVVAFFTVLSISVFYKVPTCGDGVQNQDETGIDCGGSCQYLCTEQQQPPTILFTKLIQNVDGRIDVIAKVENKNTTAAAKNVPYRITLYGTKSLVQEISGTLELPIRSTVPVFISGISVGNQDVVRAFLEIDSSAVKWFSMSTDSRSVPIVSSTKYGGTITAPRIDANLTNPGMFSLRNIKVVAIINNEKGDVFAASSTVLPLIPAQGQETATFTWNSAFQDTPASIEIIPIVQLP